MSKNNDISIKAFDFRKEHSLSDIEPINCKALLLKLNILTIYKPLSDNFSGMCLKGGNNRFILINSNNPRGRQHFTIAHELYHLFFQQDFKPHICNPGYNDERIDMEEKLADLFAAELLMPSMGLKKMIPLEELNNKTISISTILKLEKYFFVSHLALMIRLKYLKLITQEQFDKYSQVKIKQMARENGFDLAVYESGNNGLIIGDYGILAKKLFSESKISEGHYFELMNNIGIDPSLNVNE